MKTMLWMIFGLLVLLPSKVPAEPTIRIGTDAVERANYYPWISQLSQGPIIHLKAASPLGIHGRAYRAVVLTVEKENDVYLEEIISGEGGCCASVASIRRIDMEQLSYRFGFNGKVSNFKFIEWVSPTAFTFSIQDRKFIMGHIAEPQVQVTEQ